MTTTGALDADEGTSELDPFVLFDAAIERIAALDPAGSNDEALALDVVRLRRRMDRLDATFADWTLAAHRRGVCSVDAHKTTTSWLGWKTGVFAGQVRRSINHAETGELLPDTGAAWRAGKISTPAMDAITSARVPGHDEKLQAVEAEFLKLAKRGEHAGLRRLAACFRDVASADGTPPVEPNGLTMSKVLDGCTTVNMELGALDAETLRTVIDQFMDPPSDMDDRTAAQRRRDALMRACRVALGCGADGVAAVAHATVVIDWETFTNGNAGRMDGQYSGLLPRSEVERMLCDCKVTRVVMGPKSKPFDVGRTTRVWPYSIRAAIIARDQHCRWPGCEIPAPWSEIHHHRHWEHGGTTSVDNGYLLCSYHHRFLHRQPGWTNTFDDQVVRVYRPDGRQLCANPWLN